MKFKILFLLFISIFNVSCASQNNKTFTEAYNLDFRSPIDSTILYGWTSNVRYFDPRNFLISLVKRDSIYTLKYTTENASSDRFKNQLEQRILLPKQFNEKGIISFEGKGKKIELAYIVVDGIDRQEKTLYSDTVYFSLQPILSTVSNNISLKDVEQLQLKIYTEGKENEEAEITFSRLDILIGDKHIDQYPLRELSTPGKLTRKDIIPLEANTESNFHQIEAFDKRIIALGESVHGNQCISNFISRLIMYQAKSGKCKTVIIESPMEKVLLYNHYILHKEFELTDGYLDNSYLKIILEKLKEYNSGQENDNKIRLFGMDYITAVSPSENTMSTIFDFVAIFNQKMKVKELDELSLLLSNQDKFPEVLSFLENNQPVLEKHLSMEDYECMLHILKLSHSLCGNQNERRSFRDSVMYVNSKFIIEKFSPVGKQVLIYGHDVHLNSICSYPVNGSYLPLGSYLKKLYGKEFSPLLLTIGEGAVETLGSFGFLELKVITSPVDGSLEKQLSSLDENILYAPLTADYDKLMLGRFKGNVHSPQEFYPRNFYQRYAGVFFIRECETNNVTKELLIDKMNRSENKESFYNAVIDPIFKREVNKITKKAERRKMLLEEIKERTHK